jgi:hypothetical protein
LERHFIISFGILFMNLQASSVAILANMRFWTFTCSYDTFQS